MQNDQVFHRQEPVNSRARCNLACQHIAGIYVPLDKHELLDEAAISLGVVEIKDHEACLVLRELGAHLLPLGLVVAFLTSGGRLKDFPVPSGLAALCAHLLEGEDDVLVLLSQLHILKGGEERITDGNSRLRKMSTVARSMAW